MEERYLLDGNTLTVRNTNDDGDDSLRQAIATATDDFDKRGLTDTIVFSLPIGSTIQLLSPLTINNTNVTINGGNPPIVGDPPDITIAGGRDFRIFNITGTSNVEIDNLTLTLGTALQNDNNGNGGAIYDQASNLTLADDNFTSNIAKGAGGAVYRDSTAGPLAVYRCKFEQNVSTAGGAIFAGANLGANTSLTLNRCTFDSNHANNSDGLFKYAGGAVYAVNQFKDSYSTYTNNYAPMGGAIAWFNLGSATLNVSYDTFTSNGAQQGGGMSIEANAGLFGNDVVKQNVWGCLFNGNEAWDNNGQYGSPYEGGGLYASETTTGTGTTDLRVYNSTFYSNTAQGMNANGGGIYLLVNTGGTGANTTKFGSLTVYKNTAYGSGGGLYVDPNSQFNASINTVPSLLNDIIASNTYNLEAEGATGPDISGSIFTSHHNLVGDTNGATVVNNGGAWSGTDIVGNDPQLDPNGLANNGGSTLTIKPLKGSKAIGAGSALGDLGNLGTDGRLDQRGTDQQKSYTRPDSGTTIGAYEFNVKLAQQGQTSTTVVSSVNPSQVEQPVTFTATVTDDLDEGIPTGTVTFYDGDTVLGTATLDGNDNATYTTSTLTLGVHTITADYGGDGTYTASSGSLTQIVSQEMGNTFVELSSSLNPAAPGQAVTFTAIVSGDSGPPTGTVTFLADNDVLGTATLDGNDNAAFTTSTLPLGSHTITAIYNGDSTYSSNSASLTQVISLVGSTTYLTSDGSPQPGDPVTFTANVFVNNGDTPSGTVTFLNGTAIMGTAPLTVVNGQGQATFTTSFGTGIYAITAVYSGDHEFLGSSGSMVQSVGDPTTSVTSLLLGSSSFPSLPGQAVTFTAMLTWSGPTTPTGTVTFLDGTTVLGTAPVDDSGNAAFTTSTLSTGDHVITAVYSGDGTYSGSAFSAIQSVAASAATTTLTSSANPSQSGQPVTFTATIEWDGPVTPTGTVTFYDGQTPLGTAELTVVNGQVQATFTTSALGLGSHTIIAIYSGDSTYADSGASMGETIYSGIQ